MEQYQAYLRQRDELTRSTDQSAHSNSLKRQRLPQLQQHQHLSCSPSQSREQEHVRRSVSGSSSDCSSQQTGSSNSSNTSSSSDSSATASSSVGFSSYSHSCSSQSRYPRALSTETNKKILLSFDLPGVKVRNISVTVQHGVLLVKGSRNIFCTSDHGERAYKKHKFCRRFSIDTDVVDLTHMKANLTRGVLRVTAPKKNRPSRISIPVTEGDEEEDLPVAIPPSEDDEEEEDDDDKTIVAENRRPQMEAVEPVNAVEVS